MGTFAPLLPAWAWAVALALPIAVFLLYFLKLKRIPRAVPSTYLWRRSIEDLHVNSLWQRLQKNLLMLLQLLFLTLLLAGLLGWTFAGVEMNGGRYIFLIDQSASMSAVDAPGGATRLEAAKKLAAEHVDAMPAGAVGMVASFSDRAEIVQAFTDDRSELKRRIGGVQATRRPTSLEEALRAASGLANPGQSQDQQPADQLRTNLLVFSDGKAPPPVGFSLGNLVPEYVALGDAKTANLGIAACSMRRNEERPDQTEVFARIRNFGAQPVQAILGLWVDDRQIDALQVDVAGGASQGVVFPIRDAAATAFRLKLQHADPFPLDDEAWVVPPEGAKGKILYVGPGSAPLAKAFNAGRAKEAADWKAVPPEFLETAEYEQAARSGEYDLVIYDGCRPKSDPQANAWYLGALPPEWSGGAKLAAPVVVDVDRSHPLTAFVDLSGLAVAEALGGWNPPPGGRVLVSATQGPLVAVGARGVFQDLVVGFPLQGAEGWNTNWPVKESFAVFTWNVLQNLVLHRREAEGKNLAAGQPALFRRPGGPEKVQVTAPGGRTFQVERQADGAGYVASDLDEFGVYRVDWPEGGAERFAVNLVSEAESDVAPAADLKLGSEEGVKAVALGGRIAPQAAWKRFLILGLVLLLIEWWIFQERMHL